MSGGPRAIEPDVASALGAVTILAPFAFSFAGEPPVGVGAAHVSQSPPRAGFGRQTDLTSEGRLAEAIQKTMYDRCYAHRLGDTRARANDEAAPSFARSLIEANAGRERWEPGWVIYQFGANGQIFVRKGERQRIAMPGGFSSDVLPGEALQVGARVSLYVPREAIGLQPGYYFALGETLDELAEQLSLIRFYFHCGAEAAAALLRAMTSALNRFQVPFQLKAPIRRSLYGRTDAVVLYVGVRYFVIIARIIESVVYDRLTLAPSVPLFTKCLWPGIGVAVEPLTRESFGMHRCRLAAEGIVDAWREGRQDLTARVTAVRARFAEAGLDLARPYLGPGWVDLFSLPSPARLP